LLFEEFDWWKIKRLNLSETGKKEMPKGTKKPKDKNAPKRPQSSYFVYSNERRVELKRVNPEKKVTEISKMIAAEWNKKDEAGKKTL